MIRRPPRSTRTYTLFPYTTLFRSDTGGLTIAMRLRLRRLARADCGRCLAPKVPDTEVRSGCLNSAVSGPWRSEEHTSELQSLMRISYAGFCLKKKNMENTTSNVYITTTPKTLPQPHTHYYKL